MIIVNSTTPLGVFFRHLKTENLVAKYTSTNCPSLGVEIKPKAVTVCYVVATPGGETDPEKLENWSREIEQGLIELPDGTPGIGLSLCSEQDNFEASFERKIALSRAIENLPKNERSDVWNSYRTSVKHFVPKTKGK